MKRDMDFVREILLWMEEQNDASFLFNEFPSFGRREEAIGHIVILRSAGFLEENQRGVLRMT